LLVESPSLQAICRRPLSDDVPLFSIISYLPPVPPPPRYIVCPFPFPGRSYLLSRREPASPASHMIDVSVAYGCSCPFYESWGLRLRSLLDAGGRLPCLPAPTSPAFPVRPASLAFSLDETAVEESPHLLLSYLPIPEAYTFPFMDTPEVSNNISSHLTCFLSTFPLFPLRGVFVPVPHSNFALHRTCLSGEKDFSGDVLAAPPFFVALRELPFSGPMPKPFPPFPPNSCCIAA